MEYVYAQDGRDINETARGFSIRPGDIRYSRHLKKEVYDFVGFVIDNKNSKMLTVFPKHYLGKRDQYTEDDVKLLFDVIMKYISGGNHSPIADRYIGYKDNFESDYPFKPYFEVYDYYRRYGIYREETYTISKGGYGKISWKDIIQRSNMIVSNNNLIFSPLYLKTKSAKAAFISECMIYVINHTITEFSNFIHMSPVHYDTPKVDLIVNRDYVLRKLRQYKGMVFKDNQKQLVVSLIDFFEQFEKNPVGGLQHIKINYFNMIWQDMINEYLNSYFVSVDEEHGEVIFDKALYRSRLKFRGEEFHVDESTHAFKFVLDHYAEDEYAQYIFDSKYYGEITDLNYKQFSYGAILHSKHKKLYNVLLLPGIESGKYHLKLRSKYGNGIEKAGLIIEQYLDMKTVMQHYIST